MEYNSRSILAIAKILEEVPEPLNFHYRIVDRL